MCVYLLSLIRCSSKAFHLSSLLDKFLPSPSRTQHASLMKDLMFYFSKGLQVTIFHDCHYLCTAQLKGRTQNNFRLMSTGTRLFFFFFSSLPELHHSLLHSKAVSVSVCLVTSCFPRPNRMTGLSVAHLHSLLTSTWHFYQRKRWLNLGVLGREEIPSSILLPWRTTILFTGEY